MKHLFTTALLCGVSVLAAQAQSIIVTDKDGIPHKFHADYVQEITFEEIENGEGFDFKFNELTVTTYGNRNIGLNFSDGVNVVGLDLYQPGAYYLQPGTYAADGSCADFTIDPSYSSIRVGAEEKKLKSGSLTIALEGETYTFSMDFALESGERLKGSYTGVLNTFGPVLNFDLSGCNYVEINEPAANGFYYKFNDPNWKVEMRIELYSAGDAPARGTYKFSDTLADGTASSYVDLYSPYNTVTEFTDGTVTVTGEGDDTVVEIDGTLGFGMHMKAIYKGNLPARK